MTTPLAMKVPGGKVHALREDDPVYPRGSYLCGVPVDEMDEPTDDPVDCKTCLRVLEKREE